MQAILFLKITIFLNQLKKVDFMQQHFRAEQRKKRREERLRFRKEQLRKKRQTKVRNQANHNP